MDYPLLSEIIKEPVKRTLKIKLKYDKAAIIAGRKNWTKSNSDLSITPEEVDYPGHDPLDWGSTVICDTLPEVHMVFPWQVAKGVEYHERRAAAYGVGIHRRKYLQMYFEMPIENPEYETRSGEVITLDEPAVVYPLEESNSEYLVLKMENPEHFINALMYKCGSIPAFDPYQPAPDEAINKEFFYYASRYYDRFDIQEPSDEFDWEEIIYKHTDPNARKAAVLDSISELDKNEILKRIAESYINFEREPIALIKIMEELHNWGIIDKFTSKELSQYPELASGLKRYIKDKKLGRI